MQKTVTINEKEYPVYATVDEADEYFAAFYNCGWDSISPEDKAKLLVSATRAIDREAYAGKRIDPVQLLKFPRIIYGEETKEQILKEACCEEALSIYLYNTAVGTSADGIKMMKVQDTQIEFFSDSERDTQLKSESAYKLLYPYFEFGVEIGYCS